MKRRNVRRRWWLAVVLLILVIAGCGVNLKEKERVLGAVKAAIAASDACDPEAIWALLSERHRNVYAEVRGISSGELPTGKDSWLDSFVEFWPKAERAEAIGKSDFEFFREKFAPSGMGWSRGEEVPDVTVDGDAAQVYWASVPVRWHLRYEQRAWRVEVVLPGHFADMALVTQVGPGGREFVLPERVFVLSRKKVYEVPLPVVPGHVPIDESLDLQARLVLDRDGAVLLKGSRLGIPELTKRIHVFSERRRDFGDPLQPSLVAIRLAVHRELTWGNVDSVLRVLVDEDIRIGNVVFLIEEAPFPRWGIPVRLAARYPRKVRLPVPVIEIQAGETPVTPGHLAALDAILAKATDETVALGIRVEMDGGLGIEPALHLLMTVARRKPREILCVVKEGLPGKLTIGGMDLRPLPRVTPDESPVEIPLTIDLRE